MSTEKLHSASVFTQAWKDARMRVVKWGLLLLVFTAVFADFIANDTPLYCKTHGTHRFPALHEVFSGIGLTRWTLEQESTNWKSLEYQRVVFALIPYSAKETDLKNANFRGPFDVQDVTATRFRHWLGTDHLGRDVMAGLIHGTRITLLVGVCSMLLAALLGIPIGAMAGFLGDDRWRIRRVQMIPFFVFGFLILYFIVLALSAEGKAFRNSILLACVTILVWVCLHFIFRKFWRRVQLTKVPVDTLTIRSIEVIRSIPVFFLLFAILGMIRSPGLLYVILLIAVLWSPSIIRFVRAEALKLRNQTFIQSATVLGLSDTRIILSHIIPNAIGPALITITFGIGAAVLIESGLSFLGIGIAPETVSWGKMLNVARSNFSAWWMALLPGLAIFLTIALFNRFGDVLESRISGRE